MPSHVSASELSILRISAGRLAIVSSATGKPVSGAGGPGATVVVVVDSVVDVDVNVGVDEGVAAFSPLPPHDAAMTASAIIRLPTTREVRMCT